MKINPASSTQTQVAPFPPSALSVATSSDALSSSLAQLRTSLPPEKRNHFLVAAAAWLQQQHSYNWCCSAFRTIRLILLSALVSVLSGWVTALCLSSGNVFSSQPPKDQSRRTFLVGVLLWAHALFCLSAWIARSVSLFRLELISRPGQPAGALWCLTTMFRRTIVCFLFSAAIVFGIGYAFGSVSASLRSYRLELYIGALWFYLYVAAADREARRIYRNETIEGRRRFSIPIQSEQQQAQHGREVAVHATRRGLHRRHLFQPHDAWVVASLIIPTLYVHLVSSLGTMSSEWTVWLFTAASVVLKIAMQETAKFFIVRGNIHNSRTMVVMVAAPTVLIDTQVRTMFLRFQSAQMTISTVLAMAVTEIWMRVAKSLWIRRQIRRRRQQQVEETNGQDKDQASEPFTLWKAHLQQCQVIELVADMYAEYLAIGCSVALTFVMGTHPQFLLRASTNSNSATIALYWQLLLQVSVEILVDLVCCVAEIAGGLVFDYAEEERGFNLVFFILLAVVNVALSSVLYIRIE